MQPAYAKPDWERLEVGGSRQYGLSLINAMQVYMSTTFRVSRIKHVLLHTQSLVRQHNHTSK